VLLQTLTSSVTYTEYGPFLVQVFQNVFGRKIDERVNGENYGLHGEEFIFRNTPWLSLSRPSGILLCTVLKV
jgi:hypothetical protein